MKTHLMLCAAAALLLAACTSRTPKSGAETPDSPEPPEAYTQASETYTGSVVTRTDALGPGIELHGMVYELPPVELKSGLTVNEALCNRRSWREYSPEQLSLEELSGVLWAAAGINRPENDHLTAPSALGLYPIRVYAFFADGIYAYDAKAHALVRVAEGDQRAVSGTQDFVAKAPLDLVYVADLSVYEGRPIPAEHVRYLCGQDAAGCAQNVNLYAAGHGLRSVTRGSAPADKLLEVLGLAPDRYFFALAQSVGK